MVASSGRVSIDKYQAHNLLDLADKIIQRLAENEDQSQLAAADEDASIAHKRLQFSANFMLLRITHVGKQNESLVFC